MRFEFFYGCNGRLFKERMTELGYIEGKNIIYDIQKTDFDIAVYDRIPKK